MFKTEINKTINYEEERKNYIMKKYFRLWHDIAITIPWKKVIDWANS